MPNVIGVRRETKTPWERRTPVTPRLARHLVEDNGLVLMIQPSARRVFADKEYVRAGATMASDLSDADVILGVKEIAPDALIEGKNYMYFSHVIKGQPYNMPMLARLMKLGCTLIDYEKVTDDGGNRLVFFGRFAGLAGMIDTLWALGQRLLTEGHRTPFEGVQPAHTYTTLADAMAAVHAAGESVLSNGLPANLEPLIIGIAGYGNVALGVREVISALPANEVAPADLPHLTRESFRHPLAFVTFKEQHIAESTTGAVDFDLQHYYRHPDGYVSSFARHLPHLTVLMNCNYWDERYPRLVTKAELQALFDQPQPPKLRVIGDLGCDVEGAIECTLKCTDPGNPVYVWDPMAGAIKAGVDGPGPVVLAVDILPSELPLEASEEFSKSLGPFIPALAQANFQADLDHSGLPPELRRAVIVHRGELTPEFSYLRRHIGG